MLDPETDPNPCPVEVAIRVLGGKWKLLVLRLLLQAGTWRYNQLLHQIRGISAKELTRNLRELESAGLVLRLDGGENHVEYQRTRRAEGLRPILHALGEWAEVERLVEAAD